MTSMQPLFLSSVLMRLHRRPGFVDYTASLIHMTARSPLPKAKLAGVQRAIAPLLHCLRELIANRYVFNIFQQILTSGICDIARMFVCLVCQVIVLYLDLALKISFLFVVIHYEIRAVLM